MPDAVPAAIPAATLVLFRAAPDNGPDEHLFVERAATMVFAGGAIVFPGGRVDAGDRALALRFPDLDQDDAAARVAAIRETIEEAGVAIGIIGNCSAETVAQLRAHLHDGVPFGDALAALHLSIDIAPLAPFARWCPNFRETRTFDTRFYLARMPEGAVQASVDATENVRLFWASAAHVLAEADARRLKAIFPTRRNLERLAALGSFDAATAQAHAIPVKTITPWVEDRKGTPHLCIPEGLGYPVTSESIESAMRG
jgi:8-oxo-dGTP pyrophosphatase MutT (NUDIX family)